LTIKGAAIQAAVLSGVPHSILKEVLLMDVLPATIGVASGNGTYIPIVPRNTNIPCTKSKTFYTHKDNQKGISIDIYEGNSTDLKLNQYLTRFNFPIPKTRRGKRGIPIKVIFSIGCGGMIRVETDADEENKKDEIQHQLMLLFFIFLLMGTLLFLRMNPEMFQDKINKWEKHRKRIDDMPLSASPTTSNKKFDEFDVVENDEYRSSGSTNDETNSIEDL
jgi:hypothetical protein